MHEEPEEECNLLGRGKIDTYVVYRCILPAGYSIVPVSRSWWQLLYTFYTVHLRCLFLMLILQFLMLTLLYLWVRC